MSTEQDSIEHMVEDSKEFAYPILCSWVGSARGIECGYDAAFSFQMESGHLEICAMHFSAMWLRGLIRDYGPLQRMVVLQDAVAPDPEERQ